MTTLITLTLIAILINCVLASVNHYIKLMVFWRHETAHKEIEKEFHKFMHSIEDHIQSEEKKAEQKLEKKVAAKKRTRTTKKK